MPGEAKELAGRPEAENLINIYAALADHTPEIVIAEYAGAQFSTFKNALADLAVAKLTPIAGEMRKLLADPAEIDGVLKSGTERAMAIAGPIMSEVRRLVGFVG
jgi:tryptophanyl-tRNA synthetase